MPASTSTPRLRAHQRAHGTAIGANDLAIASIALTHGLDLVSDDRAGFTRVPGVFAIMRTRAAIPEPRNQAMINYRVDDLMPSSNG